MSLRPTFLCVCLSLFGTTSVGYADLQVFGYTAEKNDRFNGSPQFIGQAYDWSGVGKTPSGQWATMISPNYFLTANHNPATNGNDVTFYTTNDALGPSVTRQVIETYVVKNPGPNGPGSDLLLGRLSASIDPDLADIANYPLADFPLSPGSDPYAGYVGQPLLVYGSPNRVGANNITQISYLPPEDINTNPGTGMYYDYESGEPNEALLMGGDSGGPSFLIVDGRLVLVGTHWYQASDDVTHELVGSGDTFIPAYLDDIRANMTGESFTTAVPEPAAGVVLVVAGFGLLARRR